MPPRGTKFATAERGFLLHDGFMTFLPIVVRELRVASRRPGTYWVRSAAALVVIVAGTWLFLMMYHAQPRMVAMTLFGVLTGCGMLYALLSGVRSTADCLSVEKREGTLGLLFLTDLKGYDVVLGKLVANSLGAAYSLLAIVPVLALPLLMGGVTGGEFGRVTLVTLNTLFFSLSVGILISSLSRSARGAGGVTAGVLVGFSALLPLIGLLVMRLLKARAVWPVFLLPSPGYNYGLAFDLAYRRAGYQFWYSLLLIQGFGWAALILASLIAPRSWQERPVTGGGLSWRQRLHSWSYGRGEPRLIHRRRLLEINPFLWLAARARFKGLAVWAALGLIACGWFWGLAKFRRDWLNEGVYIATALAINVLLRFLFASETARQLAEERRAGTLELLLSTPLRVTDILRGQFLALMRQFFGPLMVTLAVETIFMFAVLSDNLHVDRSFWMCLWIGGMIMVLADLVALYWVCQWQALTAKNPARAAANSLAFIGVMPWGLYALILVFLAVGSMGRFNRPEPGWKFFLGWWFALGVGVDILFGTMARHKLLTQFREAAQQGRRSAVRSWPRHFVGGGIGPSEGLAVPGQGRGQAGKNP